MPLTIKENDGHFSLAVRKPIMKRKLKLLISSVFIALACSVPQAVHSMESLDGERPDEHLCPITYEVMRDPVVAADGHSYEREAILKHFENPHARSPFGSDLKNKDLFDNHALKAMIMDWKPGSQNGPSALEKRSAEDIAQRVREEFNKNATLLNSAKDQHIVAFLGNTGAGKSTLVNLLAGKELKVSSGGDYVLTHPDDKTAMVIGTGGNSETLYPKSIDVDGLRFFDLPGFNDTDGSERNLVNAAFIRKILLDAASVRLVFVVGHDQFTVDRGASVRQMFNGLKQLFVVGQGVNLVDNGVFVVTKVICTEQTEMTDLLLNKTDSRDKAELHEQLISWKQGNRLCRMFHAILDKNKSNESVRNQILGIIKDSKAAKVHGINVSALYPSDTKQDLERMFLNVLEGALDRKFKEIFITLSDYDRAITYYTSKDFLQTFDADVCKEDDAISLLKEFCSNPYNKAFRNFEKEKEEKRQAHIQVLRDKRQERIGDIERRTDMRAKEVISSLVPAKEGDDFVSFDFAYHRDFYDQVCGSSYISQLATDALEQEVVRRYYAGFISQHSHNQMKRWHQKFSGVDQLIGRLVVAEQSINDLTKHLAELQKKKQEREAEEIERKATAERERVFLLQEQRASEARERRAEEDALQRMRTDPWAELPPSLAYPGGRVSEVELERRRLKLEMGCKVGYAVGPDKCTCRYHARARLKARDSYMN